MDQAKKAIIALLLVAALALSAGCARQEQQGQNAGQTGNAIEFTLKTPGSGVPVITQQIKTTEGKTLFGAMQESGVQMKYREYSFGKMITSIGIIEPGQGQYLAVYVDGNYSQKGIDEIIPKQGQTIEFKLEQIQ
ncbi:Uncharacterised protein [uncultured archaeon]|nr:Uncharacterised protein [uncultured archaeon]